MLSQQPIKLRGRRLSRAGLFATSVLMSGFVMPAIAKQPPRRLCAKRLMPTVSTFSLVT